MDSEKEKNRLSDIVLERVRTHGEPSVSSRFPIPGTSGGDTKSWKSGPGRESDRSGGIQEEVSGSRSQSR